MISNRPHTIWSRHFRHTSVCCYDIVSYGCGPFYQHRLILFPTGISNYSHHNMLDEITYPFSNFNSVTMGVWERISNFISHLHWACDYLSMLGLTLIYVSKRGWRCCFYHYFRPSFEIRQMFERVYDKVTIYDTNLQIHPLGDILAIFHNSYWLITQIQA